MESFKILDKGLLRSQMFFTLGPKWGDALQCLLDGEKHTCSFPLLARERILSAPFQSQHSRNTIPPALRTKQLILKNGIF